MTKLHLIKDQLKKAGHVVVLTGAGMSQESGLPTYRASEDGLWSQHVISEVATAEALRRDPKKVWQWLQSLAQSVADAAPNAGHAALAQLQQHCKVTVVTQNVDDLHERAGSTEVIHLHGNAFAYRCVDCDRSMAAPTPLPSDWEMLRQQVRCTYCNGHIRHDVVLFNEMLDHNRIDHAHQAIRDCHVVLMVGTSNLVYPAAALPIYAIELNKFVAEINPQETPMSSMVTARLNALAASALPELVGWTGSESEINMRSSKNKDDGLHAHAPRLREHSIVEVVRVTNLTLTSTSSMGVVREPQIGDVGAVVHCFPHNASACAYEVECVDSNGKTIWLATFEQEDLKQVSPDPFHHPTTTP